MYTDELYAGNVNVNQFDFQNNVKHPVFISCVYLSCLLCLLSQKSSCCSAISLASLAEFGSIHSLNSILPNLQCEPNVNISNTCSEIERDSVDCSILVVGANFFKP